MTRHMEKWTSSIHGNYRINFRIGMNEDRFNHKLVSKQELQRSKVALRSGSEIRHLSLYLQTQTLKIIMVPGAKFWQCKTVSLLIETVKKIMAFGSFQRASCTFWKQFRSSGHHSLGNVLFVSFCRFFKSNLFGLCPISDKGHNPTKLPPSASVIS